MGVLNLPYYVAAQVGIPSIAWGGTGVAKTASVEACARGCGRNFHAFLPTHHLPEEIGGMPAIFREEQIVKMLPLDWVHTLTLPGAWLHLDEFNTGSAMMRAFLLSVINPSERRIGTLKLADDLIVTSAANPPDIAPNAASLEGSVANRFFHWRWKTPVQDFLTGIETGTYPVPTIPVVKNAEVGERAWGRKIKLFLESKPDFVETKQIEPDALSFPSLRTWSYVKRGCAAMESVGATANEFVEFVAGCVGQTAAALFVPFANAMDLYSAREVMEGKTTVNFNDKLDRLFQLPSALIFHAQQAMDEGTLTDEMVDRAFVVLLTLGEKGLVDAIKQPLSAITLLKPGYRPPRQYKDRFGALLAQIIKV
jgi:hypothetical protein